MAYGLWQGAERATGDIAKTGMKLMEFQAQRADAAQRAAIEQEKMGMIRDSAAREQKAFDYAQKQRDEQERQLNAYVPASFVAPNISKTPKLRSLLTDTLRSAGYDIREMPDGEIYLPNRAVQYATTLFKTQADFQKAALGATLADLTDRSVAVNAKIAEMEASGKMDEKTIAPLIQEKKEIAAQISGLITADVNFQKELALKKEVTTPTYRVFNNQLLGIAGGKLKVIAKGDTYQLALSSAMKDPAWQWADEAEQAELINKHMRFQKGETKPTPKEMTDEDISALLQQNGYEATPDNIATFRKNNGL